MYIRAWNKCVGILYNAFSGFNPVLEARTLQGEMSYWPAGYKTSSHTGERCQTIDFMKQTQC